MTRARARLVAMLARSNDLFTGVYDIPLQAGTTILVDTECWDAGTEVNTGLVQDIPFYGNHNVGPQDHEPIAAIHSYTVLDDPDVGQIDYTFPPTAQITIEQGALPVEAATWGAIKAAF